MGEQDIAFRRLLRELPEPVLRLVFGQRRFRLLGPVDASTDRSVQRTTDNLFRIREGRREHVLHIEIERGWRNSIAKRMFDYASAAHTVSGLPVVSIVLLLRRGGRPPGRKALYRVEALGGELSLRYHVLPLYELDAEKMRRSLPPEGWPLCVAMRGGGAALVRQMAQDLKTHKDISDARREAISVLLFVVAAAIFGVRRAREVLGMGGVIQEVIDELRSEALREGRLEGVRQGREEGRREGREEGRREGREEGRREGREEGRLEHARNLLLRQLRRRFGDLPPAVVKRVQMARLVDLDCWAERVIDAAELSHVFENTSG